MTRPKTISDEALLAVARRVFRAQGHAAATREIALAAKISEGVLYQRFGSKEQLFFAAMKPGVPDLAELLGPERPSEEPRAYLHHAIVRMAQYFSEILPLALGLQMHPAFTREALGEAVHVPMRLREGLAKRLAWLAQQKRVRNAAAEPAAQLLVSLAHDWALGNAMAPGPSAGAAELKAMVDVLWKGLAVPEPSDKPRRSR